MSNDAGSDSVTATEENRAPDPDEDGETAERSNEPSEETDENATRRVWLVERTYSDDEQNLIILVYATPNGERYLRKERALTSFSDVRPTTAAIDAEPENLGHVDDPETRDWYEEEASRMADEHEPTDTI